MPRKCECSMRVKLVGDGCSVCNPDYWRDILGEIKKPIEDIGGYTTTIHAHPKTFLIEPEHTWADVARWIHEENAAEEMIYLLQELLKETEVCPVADKNARERYGKT